MILTLQNLDRLISKNSVTHTSDLEKQRFSASKPQFYPSRRVWTLLKINMPEHRRG